MADGRFKQWVPSWGQVDAPSPTQAPLGCASVPLRLERRRSAGTVLAASPSRRKDRRHPLNRPRVAEFNGTPCSLVVRSTHAWARRRSSFSVTQIPFHQRTGPNSPEGGPPKGRDAQRTPPATRPDVAPSHRFRSRLSRPAPGAAGPRMGWFAYRVHVRLRAESADRRGDRGCRASDGRCTEPAQA